MRVRLYGRGEREGSEEVFGGGAVLADYVDVAREGGGDLLALEVVVDGGFVRDGVGGEVGGVGGGYEFLVVGGGVLYAVDCVGDFDPFDILGRDGCVVCAVCRVFPIHGVCGYFFELDHLGEDLFKGYDQSVVDGGEV